MNHLGFLALTYLILVSFDLPSPSKELHLALAYALCCYEGEIAQALDPVVLRSLRERLTTLAASLRPVRISFSAGNFTWRWPR